MAFRLVRLGRAGFSIRANRGLAPNVTASNARIWGSQSGRNDSMSWIMGAVAIGALSTTALAERKKKNKNDEDDVGASALREIAGLSKSTSPPPAAEKPSDEEPSSVVETPETPEDADTSATEENEGPTEVPLQESYKYVMVGAGTAAWSALKAIQEKDPEAQILIIGDEQHPPYNRTPLSKEVWTTKNPYVVQDLRYVNFQGNIDNVIYEPLEKYEDNPNVRLLLKTKVIELDVEEKTVRLEDGRSVAFEKVLLAPGGTPHVPQVFTQNAPEGTVSTYRTIDDYRRVEALARKVSHMTVVGGGFLGTELACSLLQKTKDRAGPNDTPDPMQVTLIVPEPGVLYRYLPRFMSEFITMKIRTAGVDVRTSTLVKSVAEKESTDGSVPNRLEANLHSWMNTKMDTDHIVVCAGIKPNSELAEVSGLELDSKNGGILVNAELAAASGVYVAGDAVSYFDRTLGRRRIEHYDHAVVSGRVAGENMTGSRTPYLLQSMFWCDVPLVSMGFEAIGLIDSSLPTVSFLEVDRSKEAPVQGMSMFSNQEYKRGVIYYLRDGKVVGVLLWNHWDQVEAARRVVRAKKSYTSPAQELRDQIPVDPRACCIDMTY